MVANLTTVLLAGFGTDRLRRSEEAMKTADRENPTAGPECPATEHMVSPGQNRSCSFKWAAKQENFQPPGEVFFLTSAFIEPYRVTEGLPVIHSQSADRA
jgi:hypothetical protein